MYEVELVKVMIHRMPVARCTLSTGGSSSTKERNSEEFGS